MVPQTHNGSGKGVGIDVHYCVQFGRVSLFTMFTYSIHICYMFVNGIDNTRVNESMLA